MQYKVENRQNVIIRIVDTIIRFYSYKSNYMITFLEIIQNIYVQIIS